MQLEDHLGDVIRKARKMCDVSAGAAGAAAGLTESALAALESSGRADATLNFDALGRLLDLHPQKLAAFAAGWRPQNADLRHWRELRLFTTAAEDLTVNCFLAWDPATREAALFDTGVDPQPVLDCIAAEGLNLRHIFITHSHWDHVDGLVAIREVFPQAGVHNGSAHAPAAQRLRPDQTFPLGRLSIAWRATPGHAMDGVTYLVSGWPDDPPAAAIVGDAIFAGSIGNGNGEWELARRKIREEILSLPADTLLCPGHGPLTTVAEEQGHNPFF